MYCFYKCSGALPHGAVSWSAVCDCGISLSYSLFCILIDFPIHIDTISMGLLIMYSKGPLVELFSKFDIFLSLKIVLI